MTNSYDECVKAGGPGGDEPCKRSFGSFHAGGFNVLFADNHVEFTGYSVPIRLLAARATIAGGEDLEMLRQLID